MPSYHYAPDEKGLFHNCLTGILRNKALCQLRKEERQKEIADRAGSTKPPFEDGMAACPYVAADQSCREAIFELALRQFLADLGLVKSVTTHYEPLDESHPKYPGYIVRHVTNSTEGTILHLSGKTFSFARPIGWHPERALAWNGEG